MTDPIQQIKNELSEAQNVLDQFLSDDQNITNIHTAAEVVASAISAGNKVISCGNGGSHCDAMHFAEELSGRFRNDRRALPAIAISDPAHITCVGNDYGFDEIFSRFIAGLGAPGDVLLAISTSGNSANVIKAIDQAKELQMKTIALTGKNGGELADNTDVEIRVPHFGYADRIQEIHIKIIHILILQVERSLGLA